MVRLSAGFVSLVFVSISDTALAFSRLDDLSFPSCPAPRGNAPAEDTLLLRQVVDAVVCLAL